MEHAAFPPRYRVVDIHSEREQVWPRVLLVGIEPMRVCTPHRAVSRLEVVYPSTLRISSGTWSRPIQPLTLIILKIIPLDLLGPSQPICAENLRMV